MNIIRYDSLESTNITAKEMLLDGAAHGTVVLADRQTGGRGRRGRKFFSPGGTGIYMSVVLRAGSLRFGTPSLITAFAAVCTCKAIENLTDKTPRIKWVNDILLSGKKICGISADAIFSDIEVDRLVGIILGIGINFRTKTEDFPEELRETAGSLFQDEEPAIGRDELVNEILRRLLASETPASNFLNEYKKRLVMLGERIRVIGVDSEYEAYALDVDDEGRLVMRLDSGEVVGLSSGEISVRWGRPPQSGFIRSAEAHPLGGRFSV